MNIRFLFKLLKINFKVIENLYLNVIYLNFIFVNFINLKTKT